MPNASLIIQRSAPKVIEAFSSALEYVVRNIQRAKPNNTNTVSVGIMGGCRIDCLAM